MSTAIAPRDHVKHALQSRQKVIYEPYAQGAGSFDAYWLSLPNREEKASLDGGNECRFGVVYFPLFALILMHGDGERISQAVERSMNVSLALVDEERPKATIVVLDIVETTVLEFDTVMFLGELIREARRTSRKIGLLCDIGHVDDLVATFEEYVGTLAVASTPQDLFRAMGVPCPA